MGGGRERGSRAGRASQTRKGRFSPSRRGLEPGSGQILPGAEPGRRPLVEPLCRGEESRGYSGAGGRWYLLAGAKGGEGRHLTHIPGVCPKALCTASPTELSDRWVSFPHFREESRGSQRESDLPRTPSTETRMGFAPHIPGSPLPWHSWMPSWFCWLGDHGPVAKSL